MFALKQAVQLHHCCHLDPNGMLYLVKRYRPRDSIHEGSSNAHVGEMKPAREPQTATTTKSEQHRGLVKQRHKNTEDDILMQIIEP